MLIPYLVFAIGAEALPYSFVLDVGSMDDGVFEVLPSAPLSNITEKALIPTTVAQTTTLSSTTPTPMPTATDSTILAMYVNSTTHTTCLPTTTVTIILPNQTPRTQSGSERGEGKDTLSDDKPDAAATPFDSSTPEPLSKWPHWFTAATFTLIFYDIITLGLFLWLWVFGYLWWFCRSNGQERGWRRRGGVSEGTMVMAPSIMDRFRRHERSSEWARSGRGYGRVRSSSLERTRNVRERELENEMRRLGMI